MAAPRTFNKEAETRKVSPDFLFSASSSASSICQGDLHAGPDLLALFDPYHYHRHHPPPHHHQHRHHGDQGDLHADPDHGGLLPLLDAHPHLQPARSL